MCEYLSLQLDTDRIQLKTIIINFLNLTLKIVIPMCKVEDLDIYQNF